MYVVPFLFLKSVLKDIFKVFIFLRTYGEINQRCIEKDWYPEVSYFSKLSRSSIKTLKKTDVILEYLYTFLDMT